MKQLFAGLCGLTLLSFISPLPPVQAQTATVATRTAGSSYDVSKEIKLTATVSMFVVSTFGSRKGHLLATVSG